MNSYSLVVISLCLVVHCLVKTNYMYHSRSWKSLHRFGIWHGLFCSALLVMPFSPFYYSSSTIPNGPSAGIRLPIYVLILTLLLSWKTLLGVTECSFTCDSLFSQSTQTLVFPHSDISHPTPFPG